MMPRLRPTRRLLLAIGFSLVLAAFLSNVIIYFGLTTGNIWWRLGELKDHRPHFGIPFKRRKPWHSEEKAEDEPLQAIDQHPIVQLMAQADTAFHEYENQRSQSFRQTVTRYRRLYGRHPPPGFKEWYKFARDRNVHNIDDFEQIMGDLRPFWAIAPKVIRNLAGNMWRDKEQGISGIHIRNHKIVKETHDGWRSNALVSLIKKFVKHLPDMDICMNRLDQPRVVVPWKDMQSHLEKEKATANMPPETMYEFTKNMDGLANLDSDEASADAEDPEWYAWHGKQYMEVIRAACPPDSPAAKPGATLQEAEKLFKSPQGGLITNFNLSTDLCTIGPHLADKHGMLYSSSTLIPTKRLVPVFGECKVSANSDILFPANMYWLHDERYDYNGRFDLTWEDKKDSVIWRGVSSGGTQNADNWQRMHRQRLVMEVNSTVMAGKYVRVLSESESKKGDYVNHRDFQPSTFAAEHTDVGFTETWGCVPDDCNFYEGVWSLKPSMKLAEQFKHKFLVDVDGHSFSGRWHAFLESKALGIKATIFREWHDSRLFAWRHFVPMDNRYDDIYTILTYFLGVGSPPGGDKPDTAGMDNRAYVARHDTEGKRLADQGREWAKKVLRREDIEIYMFRLLIEYGRIIDDNRDRIGYSGDGSEFDKYDGVTDPSKIPH